MNAREVKKALVGYCSEYKLLGIEEATAGGRRFDFWWMMPSFSNQATSGIEIKVSRADFLADKKWRGYLPYCEKFYFACPAGLIKAEELEPGVGLIYITEAGNVSFEKRAKKRPMSEEAVRKMLLRVIFKLHFREEADLKAEYLTEEPKP